MAARFGALRASYFRERMDAIPGPGSPLTVSYQLAVVDDLAERAAVGLGDGAQRAIGGVAHAEEEGDVVVGGHAEDLAGLVLVADRGVAGADAEVGGGERHGVGGLPEVVVVDEAGAVVVGPRGRPARWRRPLRRCAPRRARRSDSARSWSGSVTMTKSQCCRLDADGARQACLRDPVEVGGRHRVGLVAADVAPGTDGVPGLHGGLSFIVVPGRTAIPVYPYSKVGTVWFMAA